MADKIRNLVNRNERYPLGPDQIAMSHYMQRFACDDELRNDPR